MPYKVPLKREGQQLILAFKYLGSSPLDHFSKIEVQRSFREFVTFDFCKKTPGYLTYNSVLVGHTVRVSIVASMMASVGVGRASTTTRLESLGVWADNARG